MRMPPRHVLAGVLLGLLLAVVLSLSLPVWAGRNSAGTYSLPPGNPVVPGTPISSSWANSTLADIANELTSSLDRQGRGAMAAPLQLSTGTAATPSLTFSGDTNTGLFRPGGDSVSMATAGVVRQTWTVTGATIGGDINVTGSTVTGGAALASANVPNLTLRNATNQSVLFMEDGRGSVGTKVGRLVYDSGVGLGAPAWQFQVTDDAGLFVAAGLTVFRSGGIAIGPTGTPISASYGATFNINHGNILANTCANSGPQVLNGVSLGGVCTVSTGTAHPTTMPNCSVTAANTVRVSVCNVSTVDTLLGAVDFHVRVFQP